VIEDDLHSGWERLLPEIGRKDPSIPALLKARVGFPLIFERALIELTPRRTLYWADDRTDGAPVVSTNAGGPMSATEDLAKLEVFPQAVLAWVGEDGYPVNAVRPGGGPGRGGDRPIRGPDRAGDPDRCRRRGHGQPHPAPARRAASTSAAT